MADRKLPRKGLAGLSKFYLDVTLDKNWKISASNWEAEKLTDKQIQYAANDALTSLNVALKISFQRIFDDGESLTGSTRENLARHFRDISAEFVDRMYVAAAQPRDDSKGRKGWRDPENTFKGEHKVPTRKTPLYDNALLEAPDGQTLCACDSKKADWYVQKNLGEYITKEDGSRRRSFDVRTRRTSGRRGRSLLPLDQR